MALYAFAIIPLVWVLWAYKLAFRVCMLPFVGRLSPVVEISQELRQSNLPSTGLAQAFPLSTMIYFQFAFAAITIIIMAGALLELYGEVGFFISEGLLISRVVLLFIYHQGSQDGLVQFIYTATSLLVWTLCDRLYFHKPSILGAVNSMIYGLARITPAAGVVAGWGAIVMGFLSGAAPWMTMNLMEKKSAHDEEG
ncbi:hypothetical protein ACMFMG_005157 [Clarireedia jacksonii]